MNNRDEYREKAAERQAQHDTANAKAAMLATDIADRDKADGLTFAQIMGKAPLPPENPIPDKNGQPA